MKASYKKLWKILVDKDMSKAALQKAANLSAGTMTKMRKSEDVSMEALRRVCQYPLVTRLLITVSFRHVKRIHYVVSKVHLSAHCRRPRVLLAMQAWQWIRLVMQISCLPARLTVTCVHLVRTQSEQINIVI